MVLIIVLSVIFTAIISAFMSIGFSFISQNLMFAVFWITLAVQWIIMHPINKLLSIKNTKLELKRLDKISKIEDLESKQLTTLECAYCGSPNAILIDVNAENIFTCSGCENENKIVLQFTTSRTTEPLITDLNVAKDSIYDEMNNILDTGEDDDGIDI
jgi:hypothetical protein